MAHNLGPVIITKANRKARYTNLYNTMPAGFAQAIDSRHAKYVRDLFRRLNKSGGRVYNIYKVDTVYYVRRTM